MQKQNWLEELRVGDTVIIVKKKFSTVGKVTGVSRKSVFVEEEQFSKWDACSDFGRLEIMNDENLEKIQKHREETLQRIASLGGDPTKYERLNEWGLHEAYEALKYKKWLEEFDSKYQSNQN